MNQQEKIELLREYLLRRPDLRVLVETGLYNGRGSGMGCLDLVDIYVVIDLDVENVNAALAAGATWGYVGDSAIELPIVLDEFERIGIGPALFWLDAHKLAEYDGEDRCPLLAELAAIVNWEHAGRSVVAIDDVRLFSDRGNDYFPSLEQVHSAVAGVGWQVENHDDVLAFVSV